MNKSLIALLKQTNGRFFTVTFTKKNGEVRTMNCRLGVKKFLKNGDTVNRSITDIKEPKQYLNVWDNTKRAYRSVNMETIIAVQVDGMTILNHKEAAKL